MNGIRVKKIPNLEDGSKVRSRGLLIDSLVAEHLWSHLCAHKAKL